MKTRYGVSPWVAHAPRSKRPRLGPLRESGTSTVVIVGGGLTGVMTAYAFASAGVTVTLLEAERLGSGGSLRGPGVMAGEANASLRATQVRYGRKVARAMFELSRRAVLDLATTARRLGLKSVSTGDAYRVLSSFQADEKDLAREVAERREIGLDAVWQTPSIAIRHTGVDAGRPAVRLRDWGATDPARLLDVFTAAAIDRGAALHEQSPVRRLRVKSHEVEVQTAAATLSADTVVICTGEPTSLFRPLHRHFRADERSVVLTERVPAIRRRSIPRAATLVTDTESPSHTLHWREDGRLVIAGADHLRPVTRRDDRNDVQRTGQLMYEVSRLYPTLSGVQAEYGWSMPLGSSVDEVMYAGPHRFYPRHLFAWGTRHDPAQAFLASRLLLRHYLGDASPADHAFAFTRG